VRRVFADTLYWLAIFVPGDEWAEAARAMDISDASLVTTEDVLSEFLTAVSAHDDHTRRWRAAWCAKFSRILASRWSLNRTNHSSPGWRYMTGAPTNNTA
jgi:hypothetical protein